ncbi:MAG: alpha/beta hydrolase [Candidatus Promineifilaceae bacterium]|nr:alpha/beta hydrolase [Candidatus Promineifilaceae bacterium]
MSDWFSGDIVTNGVRIRYHRTGGDKPSLLIAHGVTDNGLSWSRFARALELDYDVILYDRRGHGFSDAPDSGYTFQDHAEDMVGLITTLNLDRPHIVGHSGGAVAASILAATHPDLLTSLTLEDPSWGTAWGGWQATTAGMSEWFRETVSLKRRELIAKCREMNPDWLEEEVELWADSKVQVSPQVVQTFEQAEPAWQEILRQITCPILLIVGDQDLGSVNTPEDVEAMAAVWHRGQTVTIDGAGHTVHCDRFEPYLAAVKSFLSEIAY